MILVSDGEFFGHDPRAASAQLGTSGVTVHTIAVGAAEGVVPVRTHPASTMIADDGRPILSRPAPDVLSEIAQLGHGLAAGLGVPLRLHGQARTIPGTSSARIRHLLGVLGLSPRDSWHEALIFGTLALLLLWLILSDGLRQA